MILLKLSIVVFIAGNLLDMGLQLNLQDALRGLRRVPTGPSDQAQQEANGRGLLT